MIKHEAYEYLRNKRPDWMPPTVRGSLSKDGRVLMRSTSGIAYWELMLIGFNDPTEQQKWMAVLSHWVGEWHNHLRRTEKEDRHEMLSRIIDAVEREG
ncbi:MAG: hypothetical protein KKH53_02610 [Gammaproteobacteria bacterium]|uniref:Uncharacterized protein n=1 Tax=viral metagenome TaxID=1070528 RepID=A0A6M3KHS2_9ZZZZ|nr:hypothetical protein [Gammaproteobacteria bacterium]